MRHRLGASAGDRAAVAWSTFTLAFSAYFTGDVDSAAAESTPVTSPACRPPGAASASSASGVGEVRVGLIVHATEYFNMADLLTQVGILPPPPG